MDIDRRIEQATDIIQESGFLSAIVSVIKRSDLEDIILRESRCRGNRRLATGIDQPDYLCFLAYGRILLEHVYRKHPEVERVNFVVSQKSGVSEHLKTFHAEMIEYLKDTSLGKLAGTLLPMPMEDVLPLQVADFLCWHWQRYYASGEDGSKMERADERRMGLLGETSGREFVHTREHLEELSARFFPSSGGTV